MRPKFIITNAIIVALIFAASRFGMFVGFPALGHIELAMCGLLLAYALAGAVAAFAGNWRTCGHIANSLPMFGLAFTGLGLILAVSGLNSLTPEAMAGVFRALAFSIAPNIAGVVLMAWLRELAWWCVRHEV